MDPPLTTVHVPHRGMGTGAAQILVSLINGETFEKSENFKPLLNSEEPLGMLSIYYNEEWNNSKKPTKTRLLIYFFTESVNFTFEINLAIEITHCL